MVESPSLRAQLNTISTSALPSTARSMMVGRVFLVLTGACQFGHGVGGFTTNFIHSRSKVTAKARAYWRGCQIPQVPLRCRKKHAVFGPNGANKHTSCHPAQHKLPHVTNGIGATTASASATNGAKARDGALIANVRKRQGPTLGDWVVRKHVRK